MKFTPTKLHGAVFIEPRAFSDRRGYFMETYNEARFQDAGISLAFVQDNHSYSLFGTLRGLHYQCEHPQGKLVRVVRGAIFDVAVDLRLRSPTFGEWIGAELSDSNRLQLYMPPGFAHGFCAISDVAEVAYKCTDFYYPEHERTLIWNDPHINIRWPVATPLLSEKDDAGLRLSKLPVFNHY